MKIPWSKLSVNCVCFYVWIEIHSVGDVTKFGRLVWEDIDRSSGEIKIPVKPNTNIQKQIWDSAEIELKIFLVPPNCNIAVPSQSLVVRNEQSRKSTPSRPFLWNCVDASRAWFPCEIRKSLADIRITAITGDPRSGRGRFTIGISSVNPSIPDEALGFLVYMLVSWKAIACISSFCIETTCIQINCIDTRVRGTHAQAREGIRTFLHTFYEYALCLLYFHILKFH